MSVILQLYNPAPFVKAKAFEGLSRIRFDKGTWKEAKGVYYFSYHSTDLGWICSYLRPPSLPIYLETQRRKNMSFHFPITVKRVSVGTIWRRKSDDWFPLRSQGRQISVAFTICLEQDISVLSMWDSYFLMWMRRSQSWHRPQVLPLGTYSIWSLPPGFHNLLQYCHQLGQRTQKSAPEVHFTWNHDVS